MKNRYFNSQQTLRHSLTVEPLSAQSRKLVYVVEKTMVRKNSAD